MILFSFTSVRSDGSEGSGTFGLYWLLFPDLFYFKPSPLVM